MGKLKDSMMAQFNARCIMPGDWVEVDETTLGLGSHRKGCTKRVQVTEGEHANTDGCSGCVITVKFYDYTSVRYVTVPVSEVTRCSHDVGANPFPKNTWRRDTVTEQVSNYGLISRLFWDVRDDSFSSRLCDWKINGIPVKEANLNPSVTTASGEKKYFQRPLCWTLEQKQALIDSIYQGLPCGTIVVRTHTDKEVNAALMGGDTEFAYNDVIDGKQRVSALHEFIKDGFPDSYGNYWSDLSDSAQREFEDAQNFGYIKMGHSTTDADVIDAFLSVNFTGVPQSPEHIEYVKGIAKLLGK